MRRHRKQFGALALSVLMAAVFFAGTPARASVAVLVEQPYGGLGMNPAGHSAVYLDHVCAASPTKLRACQEGELGAVISRYNDVGGYDWLAMPLVAYLYAVDSPAEVPETMDRANEIRLRNEYRREHLTAIVPDRPDGSAPEGNWYQLVGSAYDRTLYGFQVNTTAEQDAEFIAVFNDRKNVERYIGAFRNCADFARVTINRFYPHAIRRNLLADFGVTTPKHVAHALTKYGDKHPEAGLSVFMVPQVAGTLPRSRPVKGVTEGLLTTKRWVVPITAVYAPVTAALFVAYMGNGRFAMPTDAPVLSVQMTREGALAGGSAVTEADLPVPPAVVKTSFAASSASLLSSQQ